MNPFFDISAQNGLPDEVYQLENLGSQRIYASFGKRVRGDWGERDQYQSSHIYTDVTAEDYDHQFVSKLLRIRPSYKIDGLINHHFNFYLTNHPGKKEEFIVHMQYEIFQILKKRSTNEAYVELFDKWIKKQSMKSEEQKHGQTVNNTINVGNVNAPLQFQQNSDHSVQTQHNHLQKDQIKDFLEILKRDIQQVDESIRKDFAMEMDYAIVQLGRDRDVMPQLSTIGGLMKDVGIGTFTNLLAAPIFEVVKPYLGL
ncbi:hypothetical protein [Pedobacter sp. MR22-3]|uniref:hypothetical protein n=1 Tax=Pedobacter sp. MR22-3 TaxID=2994552 RepID=UPI002247A801|nr:hypothetical protein [Pedobacter sp. MR22-3]MCX2585667.1 hypothetical protein [Pedobacter sp. MR22-3]